ncbi:NAD(P)/FAD-dependent oxidoreductase [candidate division FCPU426 bacterium]|nr:NAD(P)/FAD-dependent oxidoreductase [candidate division FCPU426 bacterium]
MKKTYDVIIIGGGVVGTSIARELSRFTLSVALLEKEAELAFGVSKSNSGIIHPGTQNPPFSLKGRLCVEGNRLMRTWARELGVHFVEVGECILIFEEKERAALLQIKADAESLGVPGLRLVDRAWLRDHEPNVNPEALAALYAPSAGIISPYRLVYDLAENAVRNGAEIFLEQKVVSLRKENNLFWVGTESGESFQSRFLINAAGLFADEVARLAGIHDITIRPRKGEEYLLDKKRENLTRHLLFPLPTKTSKGILVIKTADGNPMVGPTARPTDDKEDLATTDQGLQEVLAAVQKMVPSIRREDIIAYFAGLRPVAGDDFILRHEHGVPGMIQAAGMQSPGLTAAPAVARCVCSLLAKNGLALRRKWFFHRHRKAARHLFTLPLGQAGKLIRRHPPYGDIVCRCEMVSAQEVRDAVHRGARTLDGIKFRTRAQAGRCHGGFCTTRIMKILAAELNLPPEKISKRGPGSEIVMADRDTGVFEAKDQHEE